MTALWDFEVDSIDGQSRSLSEYGGGPALVVNVASECGLTPQYAQLEELYGKYRDRGFTVLGFPCNQFGAQEPGTEAQILEFCTGRYGVSFPMFSKIEVNGAGRHPLYAFLTEQPSSPEGPGDISWNFAKFLVDRQGRVAARYSPRLEPTAPELCEAIERLL